MTLRTNLVIAGDASSAVAALEQTDAGLTEASSKAAQLSAAYAKADQAADRLAGAQVTAGAQTAAAKAAFDAGEISLKDYNARLIETKSALSLVEAEHRSAVGEIRKMSAANDTVGPSLAQARAGYTNFGRQVQDVAVMLQNGANIGTVIALQGGQVADAVAQMGGRFSGLAKLLAGPLGTAILVVTSSLLNMAQAHWDAAGAAEGGAKKQLSLADALDRSRFATDAAREAIAAYNEEQDRARAGTDAMIKLKLADADANIKQAISTREKIQAELDYQRASTRNVLPVGLSQPGGVDTVIAAGGLAANSIQSRIDAQTDAIRQLEQARRNLRIQDAARDAKAAADPIQAINNRYDDMAAAAQRAAAGNEALSLSLKATLSNLEKRRKADLDAARARTGRTRSSSNQAAARAEFGEDAAKRIGNIGDQYANLPSQVEKANKSLRELDDIASDLQRRTPPGYERLIAQAQALKPLIKQSLLQPFDDYLEKSREAARIDELLIAGRDDEAAVLKVILSLKGQMEPLDREQLAAVLATVQGERARALVLRDQRALIDANINAVHSMRGALEQTVADALRGRFSIDNILNSLASSYIRITSQRIVESMFGATLRSIEEQASGGGKIDTAATAMSTAMDTGSSAVTRLVKSINNAIAHIDQAVAGTPAVPANDNGAANDNGPGGVADNGGVTEVTVTGKAIRDVAGMDAGSLLVGLVTETLDDIGVGIPKVVGDSIKVTLAKIEKALPQALAGAFTGASVSRIILGDRGTGGVIGSSIGGALGQKAGEKLLGGALSSIASGLGSFAGPIGAALGGIVGGLIGGIFKKRESASSGAITSVDQTVSVSGNNSEAKGQVSALSSSVQTSIAQVAKQLDATIGSFSVAIGKYGDYYRVSASGTQNPSAKYFSQHNTNPDSLYDGPDANVALGLAIQNAIADGAVQGISTAVKKALSSSSDIDKALAEALKVQDLELALGGLGARIQKEIRTFEQSAKERLRIARAYGFDIVKVEELNAKDRLALNARLLDEQVGSLQSLIDEITSGSLFEGSAVDRRAAILGKIATARADTDAGKDGAADTLARLLQDLNAVSRDVYGTTGGFAADQTAILDAARDSIAKANLRIQDAQKTSDPALTQTNAHLDESNDQLAKIAAAMNVSIDYLKMIAANGNIADYGALRAWAGY